jgi:acetyl-CoA carboxylase biotin carboxylase subunit
MFAAVLIANRGEIAVRIARTCRELGIRTVAVHSTADRDSAVVRLADESVQVGPAPARHSYLKVSAIIAAALQAGVDAIHPGYGFLAENPDFAEICAAHGLTFVGPPAAVMARLGDKAVARRLMERAGLPVLPGSTHSCTDETEAARIVSDVGFPLIIKAAAGGGGLGMTVVWDAADFSAAFRRTQAHAEAVFGDQNLYLERFVVDARHVEVQVLGDVHGNVVHLGERDCSVQRRRQKLIEETPAPELPPGLADRICAAAVRGARAVGYVGAGTFEFVVNGSGEFWFLEINCRIQVEHPVTEMVTGIDLVREQLNIAAGLPLLAPGGEVTRQGSALECRVNTEDPDRGFLPTAGTLSDFRPPGGPFTRVDTHGFVGCQIPSDYDSLLAKVVVWGSGRDEALHRMERALHEFAVAGPGIRTTIPFLRKVLASPVFREARHTTAVADDLLAPQPPRPPALTGPSRNSDSAI